MDKTTSPYFSDTSNYIKITGDHTIQPKGESIKKNCKRQNSNDIEKHNAKKFGAASCDQNIPSCSSDVSLSKEKLDKSFFDMNCIALSKALLGQVLARKVNGRTLRGIIVETESYLGGEDVASHSYNGKRTPRNEPMYMEPGTLYVYSIYGMYYCLNVSSKEEGSCVLIRSLEPVDGIDEMMVGRSSKRKTESKQLKHHELCNGPSKLCLAMNITKDLCNKIDATTSDQIWLEKGQSIPEKEIVISKRIGIESAGEEWANKPLRFYVFRNKHVSVKDKKAEASLLHSGEN